VAKNIVLYLGVNRDDKPSDKGNQFANVDA
jgi:hypothetical protein